MQEPSELSIPWCFLMDGDSVTIRTGSASAKAFSAAYPAFLLERVVQLGAGGAGAATAYALMKMVGGDPDIVDPDRRRCLALVDRYIEAFGPGRISLATNIEASLAVADGLVHATPTGMKSHPGLPIPGSLLRSSLWVAEIVYFPLETELLSAARGAGCRTLDGSGMAVYQAIEAFRLFAGMEADPERMHRHFIAQAPN